MSTNKAKDDHEFDIPAFGKSSSKQFKLETKETFKSSCKISVKSKKTFNLPGMNSIIFS